MAEEIYYCDTNTGREWLRPPSPYCGEFSPEGQDASQREIDNWITRYESVFFPAGGATAAAAAIAPDLEARFLELAERWERETAFVSATPMRVMHESYQSIMSMGPNVLPILLKDLQGTRRHWFWALRHLTGADPVPEKDRGNVDRMIAAWITWGKEAGKL